MSLQRLPNHCLLEAYEQALARSLPDDFVSLLRNELLQRMDSKSDAQSASFMVLPKAQLDY